MGDHADDLEFDEIRKNLSYNETEYPDPLDLQVRMARRVRPRKARRVGTGKLRFLSALKGTRGIKKLIADRLGVAYCTVTDLMERPDWQDVKEAWRAEKEKSADKAEDAILKSIEDYDDDPALATTNAKWLLSKLRPREFGDKTTTVLEGGETPLKILQGMVDLNTLVLSPEIKRQVLQALDAKDAEEREAVALQAPVAGVMTSVPAKAKVTKGATK